MAVDFLKNIGSLLDGVDQRSSEHLGAPHHDGNFFRTVATPEQDRLKVLIMLADAELEANTEMPEDAQGRLRSISGKARLIVKNRIPQFDEICEENINPGPGGKQTGPLDLAGLWDLIMIEVNSIYEEFRDFKLLVENNWMPLPIKEETKQKTLIQPKKTALKSSPSTVKQENQERDLARKKRIEELRKLKNSPQQKKDGPEIEILEGRKSCP